MEDERSSGVLKEEFYFFREYQLFQLGLFWDCGTASFVIRPDD